MRQKILNEIAAERTRQTEELGWTPEHDDTHTDGFLALLAIKHATSSTLKQCIKPRRKLIKAGALILAEIERLDRMGSNNG